ncbi:hypothetical protein C0081_20335 [Cohaesibacter celericrescens]|uniref:IclR family transcriptional regulator n=2 Tax=Cohaesibacter celericrescens TaxID=2067669 RepID=A0A2N5XLV8_9HYPH|nr:hypothetical protein C0081_20335 [Cohaesibacter celericrescens]
MGNKELAEKMQINEVRVNRLLRTLKSIGMAEQNAQKKYMPGPVVHVLAAQSFHSSAIFRAATKVAINRPFDDRTLAIGVLWQDSVVYMFHAQAHQNPAEGLGGYHLYHASQSSIGQVLMAELDDEELSQITCHWEPNQKSVMMDTIEKIRREGYVCRCDPAGKIDNIASTFTVGGAKAGIAFTDFHIDAAELDNYVGQLRELINEIESYA